MASIVQPARSDEVEWVLNLQRALTVAAGVFLFVVPMPHTVSLRLITLSLLVSASVILVRRRAMPTLPLKLPLILWASLALLSVIWAVNPTYSLNEINNEIVYTFLAFFVFYSQTREQRKWDFWMASLVAVMAATSTVAIASWHAGDGINPRSYVYPGVGSYTTLAITVFPFLILTVLGTKLRTALRGLAGLTALTAIVAAYVTGNRMFWLALIGSIVVFFGLLALRAKDTRGRWQMLFIMLVIGATCAFSFLDIVGGHPGRLADDPRLPLWSMAWDRFLAHPWIGQGFGLRSFHYAYPEIAQVNAVYWHPHNLLLNYVTSTGIFGAATFVLLFAAIFRELWRVYQHPDMTIARIGVAGLAMVTGVLIKNMTDVFFNRENSLMFWSLLGMTLGYAAYRRRSQSTSDG
jgi:O-antigen ligase